MKPKCAVAGLLLALVSTGPGAGAEVTTGVGARDPSSRFPLEERMRKNPWLWEAPRRPPVPEVRNRDWPLSATDAFVLARLEAAGLRPAPAAEDATWLRRVHFALTGLPPGRTEIQAFLADAAPGSRERVVDQLLGSPHFGERWARHWMDLMRYAETRGHESDFIIANAWHYRDYLIHALNEDVPYDQFLREHIAGDLLPRPRLRPGTESNESVLATGWAFLGEEVHSPVDIRQDECERMDNKVDVFSKAFLGLTISCARCHDHKFDPIRAQDYYALTGFMLGSSFRQVRFEAMENNRRLGQELAALRTELAPRLAASVVRSRESGIQQLAAYLMAARRRIGGKAESNGESGLVQARESLDPRRVELWAEHLRQAAAQEGHPLHLFAQVAVNADTVWPEVPQPQGTSDDLPAGARVIADYSRPERQPWKVDGEGFGSRPLAAGEVIPGRDLAHPIAQVMTHGAAVRDLFWNRIKTSLGNENDSGALGAVSRSGQMVGTPTVTLTGGKLHYLIRGKTRVYAAVDSHIMVEGPLHAQLVRRLDSGAGSEPRWVTHDLSAYAGHRVHLEFGPDGDGALEILKVVESETVPRWSVDQNVFVPAVGRRSAEQFAQAFQEAVLAAGRSLAEGTLVHANNALQQSILADWLVQNPQLFGAEFDVPTARLTGEWLARQEEIASRVRWESATAVSWFDGTGVDENVLLRGKPFQPDAVSPRRLPVALGYAEPIAVRDSSGRHQLAQQLVDPANPLVARVLVNRVWHHLFGRGIVATVDNFGALGDRPSHPELLDHLAWQWVHEDRWSLKRLIKRLVLTRTYAMSSRLIDPHAEEVDPSNAWLHRMPVRRLEAEVIRDALLAVSGRLSPSVGGPPEPVHLTEFLIGRGRPDQSGPLDGDGRRSIYTAVRRNFLPTLFQAFDGPTPFSTVGKRNVSNVPAQSLAMMNDPLFHQQARVWAERLLRETPAARDPERVRWLIESAYGRAPQTGEIQACVEALAELRQVENGTGEADIGAWTELAHALLNASDFIYVK